MTFISFELVASSFIGWFLNLISCLVGNYTMHLSAKHLFAWCNCLPVRFPHSEEHSSETKIYSFLHLHYAYQVSLLQNAYLHVYIMPNECLPGSWSLACLPDYFLFVACSLLRLSVCLLPCLAGSCKIILLPMMSFFFFLPQAWKESPRILCSKPVLQSSYTSSAGGSGVCGEENGVPTKTDSIQILDKNLQLDWGLSRCQAPNSPLVFLTNYGSSISFSFSFSSLFSFNRDMIEEKRKKSMALDYQTSFSWRSISQRILESLMVIWACLSELSETCK